MIRNKSVKGVYEGAVVVFVIAPVIRDESVEGVYDQGRTKRGLGGITEKLPMKWTNKVSENSSESQEHQDNTHPSVLAPSTLKSSSVRLCGVSPRFSLNMLVRAGASGKGM